MRLILIAAFSLLSAMPAAAACDGREMTTNVNPAPVCVPEQPRRIVVLDGASIASLSAKELARRIGVLSQGPSAPPPKPCPLWISATPHKASQNRQSCIRLAKPLLAAAFA